MVKVDKKRCTGCGLCSSICPEVFELGDDGIAKVKPNKKAPCVKEAIDSCPADAIK